MTIKDKLKSLTRIVLMSTMALSPIYASKCGQIPNMAPLISYYTPVENPIKIAPGKVKNLVVEAIDEDGDDMKFNWYRRIGSGNFELIYQDEGRAVTASFKPNKKTNIPTLEGAAKETSSFNYEHPEETTTSNEVMVEVTDGTDTTSQTWSFVNESNNPPTTPTKTGFSSVYEKELLTGSLESIDPDGDSITYTCNPLPANSTLNSNTGAFSWQTAEGDAGSYNMNCYAADSQDAKSGEKPVTLTVLTTSVTDPNNAPNAVVSPSTLEKLVNEKFVLDSSASSDPDEDYITRLWSTTSNCDIYSPEGITTAVSCPTTGTKIIKVTVSDGDLSDDANSTATISEPAPVNNAPVVNAGKDLPEGFDKNCFDSKLYSNSGECSSGYNISSNLHTGSNNKTLLSAAASDPDGDSMTYKWTRLSGPTDGYCYFSDSTAKNTEVYCNLEGNYVLKFKATDEHGLAGEDTMNLYLRDNLDPVADAGPGNDTAIAGTTVVGLEGRNSYDKDGKGSINGISKCEWDYTGDGIYDWSSTSTCDTTYIYSSPKTYYPKLRVTDDDGITNTDTTIVEVN